MVMIAKLLPKEVNLHFADQDRLQISSKTVKFISWAKNLLTIEFMYSELVLTYFLV